MKRVTYISNFNRPLTTDEIENIGEVSIRNNKRDELTGALFCFRNIFYQILEGPEERLDACFQRISADDRHGNVFVLNTEHNIAERQYPEWSMKTVVLDENTDSLVRPIKNLLATITRNHRILEKYTPQKVLAALQSGDNPEEIKPILEEKIILFSDIVGSTSLLEVLDIDSSVRLLDHYYRISTAAIEETGGEISKLTGDGMMAYYNADKADQAIEGAMRILRDLVELRNSAGTADPARLLYTGIGIGCGVALECNIGSTLAREYTLLGDSVNTTARLEAVTRRVKRGLVFDESLRSRIQTNKWETVRLGTYLPKGKQQKISIYSIKDPAAHLPVNSKELLQMLRSLPGVTRRGNDAA
ncbi:MAG: BLUF domain-containing protein [Leptospiraceae bacterium]|nr:BLUF domain-containing protein [Leptospiraceae bacterium]